MNLSPHRAAFRAYALAATVVILDQLSKFWVLNILHLGERHQIEVLPFFKLTMVWNQGVSFGLLRANHDVMRWALVAFAIVVIAALAVWTWRQTRTVMALALGLIIGGAVGNNLIDRVRFGAVVDFLDFSPIFPWVFNVADSAITIGVLILLLDAFRKQPVETTAPAP
ncbi:MAG: signal peptidase II [Caulobacteraceae bacterium]